MDVSDPQTLGFMVFGGFMVVSAIGIMLVSTLSMKETSYEEALAKQRRQLGKAQAQRAEKKKKSKAKKRDDQPNGKLPEPEAVVVEPVVVEPVVVEPVVAEPVVAEPVIATSSEPESEAEPSTEPPAAPEPTPEPRPVPEPVAVVPEPVVVSTPAPPPATAQAPPAPSPKEKKKKKSAKAEPVSVVETIVKDVAVSTAVEPVAEVSPVNTAASVLVASQPSPSKTEEPKTEAPSKKKKSKAKAEPAVVVDSADAPLLLPYKTLLSTVTSMTLSHPETHKLIQVLSNKAGINQDSWQLASQKGDPLSALKKQLEEKEKQLTAKQEDATAAKNRLKEITKELGAEKSKMASLESRLKADLNARSQEISALQDRMQASYKDHVVQTQQLNLKITSLQEQLDNGPNAQLTRLQQENSILRDALNKTTSQSESRQNAELAKLRQDCRRLSRELGERTEALQADQEHKKTLEAKMAAAEQQLAQLQLKQAESERALQQRLEVVSEEHQAQTQQDANIITELRGTVASTEAELKERCAELQALKTQLEQQVQVSSEPKIDTSAVDDLNNSLKESEVRVGSLEEEVRQLKAELELVRVDQKPDKDQTQKDMMAEKMAEVELLKSGLQEKELLVHSLTEELQALKAELETRSPPTSQAGTEELQRVVEERESQVAALEDQLKQLKEEMLKSKNNESGSETESEQPFESLEKDSQLLSLEEEVQRLKEELEQVKTKSNDLREKNWSAMEALSAAERLNQERLTEVKGALTIAEERSSSLQTEFQKSLQILFPEVSLDTEQSNWLEVFTHNAQETINQQAAAVQQENTHISEELLSKLQKAEESQKAVQTECDQYRTVLAETEGMLKDLQKSVEEEEHVWKTKLSEAEEQRQEALKQVKLLEESEHGNTEQLKEQVMLLEAQLEKQLESVTFNQTYAEEVAQLKALLSDSQGQLDTAKIEIQKQSEELSMVRQQLNAAAERVPGEEAEPQPAQVQAQLEQTRNKLQTEEDMRQQVASDFEQAQRCVADLEAQMENMKAAADCSSAELKERLEKEKKMTRDLGQAATKLQQLLAATQEQLSREKETVQTLQQHLLVKEQTDPPKEGTSV